MTRLKNALRGHFIAPVPTTGAEPADSDYLELAKWISGVTDDTNEETDDTGFYDGDGTKETTVTGVSGAYTFDGFYDSEDPAQALVAAKKYKIGDDRKLWHKIVSADGKKQWTGLATVSDIKAGDGDATDYEAFGCKLTFNQLPKEKAITPPSGGGSGE
ncbi:phage tail tube protein [Lactococcus lactis]|uniref:Phage tail protein n=1 Tax=Lactococcus lactis TaxID=1358 RepID=A0AAW8UFN2_9LACT|nr:phage tail protein [Lactococcus lactis]MDT2860945.1 phage tail protein [Lactococcus lactis]MDT2867122.1 phage tail protein [Lactococcus lactis]MDT2881364.1 phage tail protein [Lactococcus lactis]MDT2896241.1 phage tail protein [Lactococcus lactis]MDT2904191.1 phage tail protein [Lactococcus lactis]